MVDSPDSHYVHGTEPWEQKRLSRLNALLNAASLRAMALRGGERILDVGSGLGQFTRMLAREVGQRGSVIGVERDARQRDEAARQAANDGEAHALEIRVGDAVELPLADDEWGTFDVAHARFLLEHVTEPLAVVRSMVRSVRPGGRIILEDDDHDLLRLSPEPPGVLDLWRAYFMTYRHQGKDPHVGRHLISLLHDAGARPVGNRCLFFGSCAGSPNLEAMVDNFIGVIDGARKEILSAGLADERRIDEGLAAFLAWRKRPDAAMWYSTCWAEGTRPALQGTATLPQSTAPIATGESSSRVSDSLSAPIADEAALLRSLMTATAELNSSLKLEKVFDRIARSIRPLIDYHLFCVMLWNPKTQILEHSFSMKYGEAIAQKGGFPLGHGISGSAAALCRPVRVADVLKDPRYVRFRHPEVEIRSEMAVPLVFRDQLIGVVDLESTEPGYFTDEHEQIICSLASHVATALVNARMHERVVRQEQRLERDLSTAREIQQGLLPSSTPRIEGLEIGAAYSPARELGGDFYDYLRYADGRLALAVGDVTGKATPAALLASMAVGMLRGHAMERPYEPAEMLHELNRHLQTAGGENRHVAMTYAIYDPRSRTLGLANAGLPRALLVRNGNTEAIPVEGVPLGMLPGSTYGTEILRVSAGDVVVICSDGLTEAENEREESFEEHRLSSVLGELVGGTALEIADGLNLAALDFAGGPKGQADDYAVVVLKFD